MHNHPHYPPAAARDVIERALAAGPGLLAPTVVEAAAAYLVTGVVWNDEFWYRTPCRTLNEHVSRLLTWMRFTQGEPGSRTVSAKMVRECIEDLNKFLLNHEQQ